MSRRSDRIEVPDRLSPSPKDDQTPDVVQRAHAALDGITEGPWEVGHELLDDSEHFFVSPTGDIDGSALGFTDPVADHIGYDNARFIAASPQLVRDLLAEVEKLRGERTWPKTTPTGFTYTAPTTYAELCFQHVNAAQAEVECWEAEECPPEPTWEMVGLAHREVEKLTAERDELRAEVETAQKWAAWFAAAYNWRRECDNALNWGTTCLNCASMLDRSYDDYMRAEEAEQKAKAASREVEKLTAERDELRVEVERLRGDLEGAAYRAGLQQSKLARAEAAIERATPDPTNADRNRGSRAASSTPTHDWAPQPGPANTSTTAPQPPAHTNAHHRQEPIA